jgi:hypothetical protein
MTLTNYTYLGYALIRTAATLIMMHDGPQKVKGHVLTSHFDSETTKYYLASNTWGKQA